MGNIISNPILPGFNADPSAIWTEKGCYVVTSTFNWYPGVSLYHSKDMINWKLVENILNRTSQIDLRGNGESAGVWAPHLSYNRHNKNYYLTYTDVKSLSGSFFDLNNYVISAPHPEGPWSDPVYLNSSGFDPALFHDDDGRIWLTNLAWEFEKGFEHPGGIVMQEIDSGTCELKGEAVEIYRGNRKFGCLEGPQLYKKDNWYYLVAAEGGTGYGHAVIVSRSHSLSGPYEWDPHGPLITSRVNPFPEEDDLRGDFLKPDFYNPELNIQKSGHGSLVEDDRGRSWLFHLCARPIMPMMRCTLNRETAIEEVLWKEGWPRLKSGSYYPSETIELEDEIALIDDPTFQGTDSFDSSSLGKQWYSLKAPLEETWCSLKREPGGLSLKGRNSPYSGHDPSILARRIQHFNCRIETSLSFQPDSYRQMAGLILMTGSRTFYYLRKFYSRRLQSTALGILVSRNGEPDDFLDSAVPVHDEKEILLRAEIQKESLQFFWAYKGESFKKIGERLDATVLSDEYTNNGPGAFDGSFCGMTVQDLHNHSLWARFRYFTYEKID
jgi:xylan 1,4-beta-xylosidase